jgi:hypothetical protein
MKRNPFSHPFKPNFLGIVNIEALNGYITALNEIQKHIAEVTGHDPDKRYIDAVEILERITATINELQPILEKEKNDIENLFNR